MLLRHKLHFVVKIFGSVLAIGYNKVIPFRKCVILNLEDPKKYLDQKNSGIFAKSKKIA